MGVSKAGGYIPGNRWMECQSCGFLYRHSRMRQGIMPRQRGLWVCPTCFDHWHPNEGWTLKPRPEGHVSPGPVTESEIALSPCCTETTDTATITVTSEKYDLFEYDLDIHYFGDSAAIESLITAGLTRRIGHYST